ncbi:hypothetical protein [Candidatus Villigracilis affinis]|nr:hypothetical protein [Anaerolineales bacterium]
MKEFMDEEWEDFEKMEDGVYHTAQSLWSIADADAQVSPRENADYKMEEK